MKDLHTHRVMMVISRENVGFHPLFKEFQKLITEFIVEKCRDKFHEMSKHLKMY